MKNVFCLRNPPINPLNGKAQKLPIFNPIDKHGRVFFFAWASFCKLLDSLLGWAGLDADHGHLAQVVLSPPGIPFHRWPRVFELRKASQTYNG